MITHYDLFAGIGGFSLALEEVFDEPIRHVFCEWEQFPTAVLKQHWPDGEYWGDIADLVADTEGRKPREQAKRQGRQDTSRGDSETIATTHTASQRLEGGEETRDSSESREETEQRLGEQHLCILTGGFPCQPFSAAGRRKGTADDRYKWPEMYEVIRNVKPDWVVAENVRGLVTWNEGMVLEQVCTDLEAEGYEVQPFIIPAVAVNAPHRRDRVWIIAHRNNTGGGAQGHGDNANGTQSDQRRQGQPQYRSDGQSGDATDTPEREYPSWQRSWQEVAFATCDDSMDDGLPRLVDGVSYSRAKWRRDSLKAYGNGIVPQVAVEIMKAIKEAKS